MARPRNRARTFEPVTPSDTAGMAKGSADGFYVGVAGTVAVVGEDGAVGTFTVDAGTVLPLGGKRVNETGTTATGIVALYCTAAAIFSTLLLDVTVLDDPTELE